MTTESSVFAVDTTEKKRRRSRKRRVLTIVLIACVSVVLIVFLICLVLALTVFKAKHPTTAVVSAAVDGVAPRVTLPALRIELNISVAMKMEVRNRNHASFRHGVGTSELLYGGRRIGEAEIYAGTIPAMSNSTVDVRLTVEVEELAGQAADLARDVMSGQIVLEARTAIPGRVTFLGVFKKHVVTTSDCMLTVGVMDLKVRSQDCKYKTEL